MQPAGGHHTHSCRYQNIEWFSYYAINFIFTTSEDDSNPIQLFRCGMQGSMEVMVDQLRDVDIPHLIRIFALSIGMVFVFVFLHLSFSAYNNTPSFFLYVSHHLLDACFEFSVTL